MKLLPLIPLLAVSVAVAGQSADDRHMRAVPLGAVLGDKVMTTDERDVGELEDVLLTMSGKLEEYLIDFEEPDDSYNRGTTTFRDDVANYEEPPLYEGESVEGELQADYVAAKPDQVSFERHDEDIVLVDLGEEGFSALTPRDERRFAEREYVRASAIIGMEVDLADAESFGSVEDVVLSADGKNIAAYVVDSWDGFDKRRHALPVDAVELVPAEREAAIREDYGITAVRSDYTRKQVEAMPEFDLERFSEDTFEL